HFHHFGARLLGLGVGAARIGRRAAFLMVIFVPLGLLGVGRAAISRWQEQIEIAAGSRLTAERKLEQVIRNARPLNLARELHQSMNATASASSTARLSLSNCNQPTSLAP